MRYDWRPPTLIQPVRTLALLERTSIDYLIKSRQIHVVKHTDQKQHPGQTEQGNKDCV
jgi:hypothetical protein